jgi:hypothetical protein
MAASARVEAERRCQSCRVPLAADNTARLCGRCRREQHDQLGSAPVRYNREFFETDAFRAAFQSRNMGRVFTAYRNHPRHLTLFGKALNQETLGRWLGLNQAQVSKIERNSRPETRLDILIDWSKILHLPPEMLWFDMPAQSRFASDHQARQESSTPISFNDSQSPTFQLRNHKLIPVFVGVERIERIIPYLKMTRQADQWTACYRCELSHPRDGIAADLWVWSFGVAIFHLVEDIGFPSLASFAVWHRRVYDEQMAWASEIVHSVLASDAQVQYAMPVNWLVRPLWSGPELLTAMRVLSMPRMLLQRDAETETADLARAELVERALFRDGFEQPDIAEFGVKGISVGVASWPGVVYHPVAPTRALTEEELVGFELSIQAVWSYCDWLRSEVEAGHDPHVPSQYGWPLVRTMRSVVTNPRPEESSQVLPMRTAILETSGVTEHVKQAAETLLALRNEV